MKDRYTIRDVAALAGVSNATVSYVLSGKKKYLRKPGKGCYR